MFVDAPIMEFRRRDYRAEEIAAAMPRRRAHQHPLSPSPPPLIQIKAAEIENIEFDDPLRAPIKDESATLSNDQPFRDASRRNHSKEWSLFTSHLTQKFSYSNTIQISSALDTITRSNREYGKSLADMHMEELDDPEVASEAERKVITRQEYVSRLQQLKSEIRQTWSVGDRVKAIS